MPGNSRAYSTNYSSIDWSDFKPATPVRVIKKANGAPTFMADESGIVEYNDRHENKEPS